MSVVDNPWACCATQERRMSFVMVGPVNVERMSVVENPWAGYATQERRISVVMVGPVSVERITAANKTTQTAANPRQLTRTGIT